MAKINWTKEKDDQLKHLLLSGVKQDETAKELGISSSSVYRRHQQLLQNGWDGTDPLNGQKLPDRLMPEQAPQPKSLLRRAAGATGRWAGNKVLNNLAKKDNIISRAIVRRFRGDEVGGGKKGTGGAGGDPKAIMSALDSHNKIITRDLININIGVQRGMSSIARQMNIMGDRLTKSIEKATEGLEGQNFDTPKKETPPPPPIPATGTDSNGGGGFANFAKKLKSMSFKKKMGLAAGAGGLLGGGAAALALGMMPSKAEAKTDPQDNPAQKPDDTIKMEDTPGFQRNDDGTWNKIPDQQLDQQTKQNNRQQEITKQTAISTTPVQELTVKGQDLSFKGQTITFEADEFDFFNKKGANVQGGPGGSGSGSGGGGGGGGSGGGGGGGGGGQPSNEQIKAQQKTTPSDQIAPYPKDEAPVEGTPEPLASEKVPAGGLSPLKPLPGMGGGPKLNLPGLPDTPPVLQPHGQAPNGQQEAIPGAGGGGGGLNLPPVSVPSPVLPGYQPPPMPYATVPGGPGGAIPTPTYPYRVGPAGMTPRGLDPNKFTPDQSKIGGGVVGDATGKRPSMPSQDVDAAIKETAAASGVDVNSVRAMASIESSMNPDSNRNKSTQYKGLFQIGNEEWAKFGKGGDIFNAQDNAAAMGRMLKSHIADFNKRFGRDPTDNELYMIHQQGMGFYSKGTMTNIGGNPYPGMNGPQTHESFEKGWSDELQRRKAHFAKQFEGKDNQVAGPGVTGKPGSEPIKTKPNEDPDLGGGLLGPDSMKGRKGTIQNNIPKPPLENQTANPESGDNATNKGNNGVTGKTGEDAIDDLIQRGKVIPPRPMPPMTDNGQIKLPQSAYNVNPDMAASIDNFVQQSQSNYFTNKALDTGTDPTTDNAADDTDSSSTPARSSGRPKDKVRTDLGDDDLRTSWNDHFDTGDFGGLGEGRWSNFDTGYA